ncbi:hypothetical protein ScPMuIL_014412 [Solemya velum]
MSNRLTLKIVLPLAIVLVVYLCVGAVVFSAIEEEDEMERRKHIEHYINTFLDNNSCMEKSELLDLLTTIRKDKHFVIRLLDERRNGSVYVQWDFTGSFSFVVSVVSTIGYGDMAPRTGFGKIAVVVYALIGIPINMIFLQGIGHQMTRLAARVNRLRVCARRPTVSRVLNMLLIVLAGASLLFIGPTFVFLYAEQWDILEGLYFCFVTLSTIGFGDYIAALYGDHLDNESAAHIYRMVTYVWILFGLAYMSLIINYIYQVLIRNAQLVEKKTRKTLETEIMKLQQEVTKQLLATSGIVSNTVSRIGSKVKPREDAITSNEINGGITLLRIENLRNKETPS